MGHTTVTNCAVNRNTGYSYDSVPAAWDTLLPLTDTSHGSKSVK